MLLRNATILLALIMCLAQNLNAQNFYYGPVGKVELEISTQKILVQFNSNLNAEEQLQILSKQKNYLNLASIQNLPAPRVSILALKNMPNLTAVNTLLQSLRDEALVDYANYFLIHPDGTFHGVTNQVLLRLKSADQKSLLDHFDWLLFTLRLQSLLCIGMFDFSRGNDLLPLNTCVFFSCCFICL